MGEVSPEGEWGASCQTWSFSSPREESGKEKTQPHRPTPEKIAQGRTPSRFIKKKKKKSKKRSRIQNKNRPGSKEGKVLRRRYGRGLTQSQGSTSLGRPFPKPGSYIRKMAWKGRELRVETFSSSEGLYSSSSRQPSKPWERKKEIGQKR